MRPTAALLAVLLLGLFAGPLAASSSTPVPATCRTEPVPIERLTALLTTPVAATPVAEPALEGPAAAGDTVQAVEQTIREVVACLDAGEPLRAYALYTDGYLRAILAHETAESLQRLATPSPVDGNERTIILAIRDVRLLADGRVFATVVLDPALIPVQKTFGFFLIEENGRWLIDDVLDELEFSLP